MGLMSASYQRMLAALMPPGKLWRKLVGEAIVPTPPPPWTIDGTSGMGVPANNTEWAALLDAAGVASAGPTSIWTFQEAASPIVDVNATHNLTGVTGSPGSITYQEAVSGWTRKAGRIQTNGTDTGFSKQHLGLPSPDTTSYALFAWVQLDGAPAAEQGFIGVCDSALYASAAPSMALGTGSSAGKKSGGAALPVNTVFPAFIVLDVARQSMKVITPYGVVDGGYAVQGAGTGEVIFGVAFAAGIRSASARYLYGALFTGAAAERPDEDYGKILATLGSNVPWATTPVPPDATSGKKCPITPAQWTALGITPPFSVWPLQETFGYLYNDSVNDELLLGGGANFASLSQGNALSGWSRKALGTTDAIGAQNAQCLTASMPDIATISAAVMVDVLVTSASAGAPYGSWLFGVGLLQQISVAVSSGGLLQIYQSGALTNGAIDHRGTVVPMILMYDRTGNRTALFTPAEKIVAARTNIAANGVGVYIGSQSGGVPCANARFSLAALWKGADAEMSDAVARARLTSRGFSVAW